MNFFTTGCYRGGAVVILRLNPVRSSVATPKLFIRIADIPGTETQQIDLYRPIYRSPGPAHRSARSTAVSMPGSHTDHSLSDVGAAVVALSSRHPSCRGVGCSSPSAPRRWVALHLTPTYDNVRPASITVLALPTVKMTVAEAVLCQMCVGKFMN